MNHASLHSSSRTTGAAAIAPTDAAVRSLIAVAIRRDFAEERTVELDGWIISITEARLCAMATFV